MSESTLVINATLLEITCHGSYDVGTQNNRLIETLLLSTKTYVKTDGLENVYNFMLKVYLNLRVCFTDLLCGFKYIWERWNVVIICECCAF